MDHVDWAQDSDELTHDLLDSKAISLWTLNYASQVQDWTGGYTHGSSDEPKVGSQNSYRSTSEPDQSNAPDALPSNTNDESDATSVVGRPGHALQTSRDAMMNRIQRRRAQNRKSQRIFRQRKIEERQIIEERAATAESTAEMLKKHIQELQTTVTCLRYQCEHLTAENDVLRRTTQQNFYFVGRSQTI